MIARCPVCGEAAIAFEEAPGDCYCGCNTPGCKRPWGQGRTKREAVENWNAMVETTRG